MADLDPGSLDRLHDIVTPPPVPWWPPAPGWYVVGATGLMVLGVAAWTAVERWQRDRYRREALRALTTLPRTGNPIPALAEILKRTALAAYPREQVAALTGESWLAFLDSTGRTEAFTRGPGAALADAQYRPATNLPGNQLSDLFQVVAHWIRHHRC